MMRGVRADVLRGYTGEDHLISREAEEAANDAVAHVEFRSAMQAWNAAERAYKEVCHDLVRCERIKVTLLDSKGETVLIG